MPRQPRHGHTAARLGDAILLMGGSSSSRRTAELVPGAVILPVVGVTVTAAC